MLAEKETRGSVWQLSIFLLSEYAIYACLHLLGGGGGGGGTQKKTTKKKIFF